MTGEDSGVERRRRPRDSRGLGRQASQVSADPLALRALAHPLRWDLIDILGSEGSATATRCAEVLGESVASCSYHLGILAKYGYIEPVPDRVGREKPWRLSSYRQELSAPGLGVEGELAAQAATDVFLDHELARIKDRLRSRSIEPAEWREACSLLGATTWMTPAELREISEELTAVALRYSDRLEQPGRRPAGAREARIFFSTSVARATAPAPVPAPAPATAPAPAPAPATAPATAPEPGSAGSGGED